MGLDPYSNKISKLNHLMRSSNMANTHFFFSFFFSKPSMDGKRRRQKGDLGQGRRAAMPGPNLCAVTALWKYHLSLAAKGA